MVCKVRCGKSIKGALNYNENKVKEGKADCIDAVNFVGEAQHMTFYEKLARFQNLIEGNTRAKTNTLHISLNFDVNEKLTHNKLKQIASTCHADENCPFVPGATSRIALTYGDPKDFDGTPQEEAKYAERVSEIGREVLYAFSSVKA